MFDVGRVDECGDQASARHFFVQHTAVGQVRVCKRALVVVLGTNVGLDPDNCASRCEPLQRRLRKTTFFALRELGRVNHQESNAAGAAALERIAIGDSRDCAGGQRGLLFDRCCCRRFIRPSASDREDRERKRREVPDQSWLVQ